MRTPVMDPAATFSMNAFATLLSIVLVGCGVNESQDARRLDSLATNPATIDTAMLGSIGSTRETSYLRGPKVAEFLAALSRTNRKGSASIGKSEAVGWIIGMSGTNQVFFMNVFEDGVLSYGHYDFTLKTSLPAP